VGSDQANGQAPATKQAALSRVGKIAQSHEHCSRSGAGLRNWRRRRRSPSNGQLAALEYTPGGDLSLLAEASHQLASGAYRHPWSNSVCAGRSGSKPAPEGRWARNPKFAAGALSKLLSDVPATSARCPATITARLRSARRLHRSLTPPPLQPPPGWPGASTAAGCDSGGASLSDPGSTPNLQDRNRATNIVVAGARDSTLGNADADRRGFTKAPGCRSTPPSPQPGSGRPPPARQGRYHLAAWVEYRPHNAEFCAPNSRSKPLAPGRARQIGGQQRLPRPGARGPGASAGLPGESTKAGEGGSGRGLRTAAGKKGDHC